MERKSLEESCLSQRFRKMSGGDKNQKGFSKCLIMGKENRSFNGAGLIYPQTCVHFSIPNFHTLKDTGNICAMGISAFRRRQMAWRKNLRKFDQPILGIKALKDI